eukprot:Rmarinus@m.24294
MRVVGDIEYITNWEVYSFLSEAAEGRKGTLKRKIPKEQFILEKTLKSYLRGTPLADYSKDGVHNFLLALREFNLSMSERLQVLNLRPQSAVEIYLMLEDCPERFSDEDIEDLLQIVRAYLAKEEMECDDAAESHHEPTGPTDVSHATADNDDLPNRVSSNADNPDTKVDLGSGNSNIDSGR